MQFGVVDAGNALVGRARGDTEAEQGRDRVIANLCEGVNEACAAAGIAVSDLGAVGVAAAGAMDIPAGVILNAPNLKWINVPLRDLLSEKLRVPVVLDNDVNGAVWGEHRLGAGKGRGDALGVWVGTGVGGGLVLQGSLYHGGFFTAGEIGQTVIVPGEAPGRRTVEDLCSRTGISRTLHRMKLDFKSSGRMRDADDMTVMIDTKTIAADYDSGSMITRRVVDHAADLLGIAIANWVTVLSLKTVIIGGGITEALGGPYLDRIRESFVANVFPDRCRDCELLMTQLGPDAGLLGAALLARAGLKA